MFVISESINNPNNNRIGLFSKVSNTAFALGPAGVLGAADDPAKCLKVLLNQPHQHICRELFIIS